MSSGSAAQVKTVLGLPVQVILLHDLIDQARPGEEVQIVGALPAPTPANVPSSDCLTHLLPRMHDGGSFASHYHGTPRKSKGGRGEDHV